MKFKKRTAVVLAALMLASLGAASLSSADSNEYKAYISGYPDGDDHCIDAVRYATNRIWKKKGQ